MFRPRLPRIRTLAAFGLGAAAAYFWDPEHGPERRARFSDQVRAYTEGAGPDPATPWIERTGGDPTVVDAAPPAAGVDPVSAEGRAATG